MKFLCILSLWSIGWLGLNNEKPATLKVKPIHVSCAHNGGFELDISYSNDFVYPAEVLISDGVIAYDNGFLSPGEYCVSVSDGNGDVIEEVCLEIKELEQKDCD